MFCSSCGTQLAGGAFCPNCGAAATPGQAQPTFQQTYAPGAPAKSRVTAGVIYILLCWTYVPAIVGLVEGIIYLTQDDNTFNAKVNDGKFF